jgi:sugar lactone lactonase YvrE
MDVELVLDAKATLGEGAIWDSRWQRLLWVDIDEGEVHIFNPADLSDRTIMVGRKVGTVVPRESGGLMLAVEDGFAELDLGTGETKILYDPEPDLPDNRFNDGKCDPAGRFWAGTISLARKQGTANLYCMDTDLSVKRMLAGVTNSNGLVWSLDHTKMYYIDTPTRRVTAFDYDSDTGQIADPRPVVEVPPDTGKPDGMTIDAEGMLWVAHFSGARVTRWDPDTGEALEVVPVPALRVTSCAFGGEKLDELYITTARTGADDEELKKYPHAGGLFLARPGVRGVRASEFAG